MTNFDREEQAFREAFKRHAADAPAPPRFLRRRNRGRAAAFAAAAVAAVLAGTFIVAPSLLDRNDEDDFSVANPTVFDESQWQWIGMHALEVRAPIEWTFQREVVRPDCVDPNKAGDSVDPWSRAVPTAPYVTVTSSQEVAPSIGCVASRPGNPNPAFGDLPFTVWQPHVRMDVVRPETSALPDHIDGQWEFNGWHLARRTFGEVQVSVLEAPGAPGISSQVFSSARTVEKNINGCDTASPFGRGFPSPESSPIPPAAEVQRIAVCDYSRIQESEGLQGSWSMTGEQAKNLTTAITNAPPGGGPNQPGSCVADKAGDSAVVLRFFDGDDTPLADAHVYSQWCTGNGIVTSTETYTLTAGNCAPIYSRPEVAWWSGPESVARLCSPESQLGS